MVLDPKKDPARRVLKEDAWPEPDRRAWCAANRPGDVLEPGGAAAGWAPLTRSTVAKCYGRWLTWLKLNDLLHPSLTPAQRVTPVYVARYVADLKELNAPYTVRSRILHLYFAISVMAPDQDWHWIRRIAARLRRSAVAVREKRPRLVASDELFSYGLELMTDAEEAPHYSDSRRANQFRDGLIVALLAARPLRRRNFASIEIGKHLTKRSQGYRLHFDASETKTGGSIDAPFPAILVPHLERYLTYYRPFLARPTRRSRWVRKLQPPGMALWVSMHCSAMTPHGMYARIITLTQAKFGRGLSPHLFRDSAATSIATEDPAHVHITRSILGHTTLATSERHYNHAKSLEAMRQYQEGILALRREGRSPGRDGTIAGAVPNS